MTLVFINYRRSDSAWAILLDRELSRQFGSDRIFQASRSIPVGADFEDWLMSHLRRSSVLLSIIGPNWSAAVDGDGQRRLLDEKDWVRREISEAFTLGIPVIPVLVDDAPKLDIAELPAEIARLARCQYLRLHYRNATYDVARLINELVGLVPDLRTPAPTNRSDRPTRQAATDRPGSAESPPAAHATLGRRHRLAWSFIALVILSIAVLTIANLGKRNTSPPASPHEPRPTSQQSTLPSEPATASSQLPDGVLAQGTLRMKSQDVVNLEQGRVGPTVTESDLYLFCSAGRCLLSGTAGLTIPTTPANPASKTACTTALSSRNDSPLDLPRLRTALNLEETLCVQTQEFHVGALQILGLPGGGTDELVFSYTLWH